MALPLHTRKRENWVAVWAIAVIVAGLIFFGARVFLTSQAQVGKHLPLGAITHSTPVGGKVLDGVFRSSPDDDNLNITRWRI